MQKITVYAGPSSTDSRPQSVADWSEYDPEEALRRIGLEYKTADYFSQRQVVIVIDPADEPPEAEQVRRLMRALEASGVKFGLVEKIRDGGIDG